MRNKTRKHRKQKNKGICMNQINKQIEAALNLESLLVRFYLPL